MGAETWKPVVGYEGYYEVSDQGNLRSVDRVETMKNGRTRRKRGRLLKQIWYDGKKHYRGAMLCKDGKHKRLSIHRLVAEAFVSNPDMLPEVNHKDENKLNNRADNLEWCDRKHNNTYGTAKLRAAVTQGKPVLQLDLDGNIINAWPSEGLAAEFTSASQSGISACCNGICKTSGGFGWRFAPWAR